MLIRYSVLFTAKSSWTGFRKKQWSHQNTISVHCCHHQLSRATVLVMVEHSVYIQYCLWGVYVKSHLHQSNQSSFQYINMYVFKTPFGAAGEMAVNLIMPICKQAANVSMTFLRCHIIRKRADMSVQMTMVSISWNALLLQQHMPDVEWSHRTEVTELISDYFLCAASALTCVHWREHDEARV